MLSPHNWMRNGRGKTYSFCATYEELQLWLIESLPGEEGPYTIVRSELSPIDDRIPPRRFSVTGIYERPLNALAKSWHEDATARNEWIRAAKRTASLDNVPLDNYMDSLLSLNGLLLLQHYGVDRNGLHGGMTVGIVDKIENLKTGQKIEHSSYLDIYKKVISYIKRKLKYECLQLNEDGTTTSDSTTAISEGVAEEIARGVRYMVRPGNILRTYRA